MSASEKNQARRRKKESPETDDDLAAPASPEVPPQNDAGAQSNTAQSSAAASNDARRAKSSTTKAAKNREQARDGPRFWALPDANLGWWILRENDTGNAAGLTDGLPSISIPELSTEQKVSVGECCRTFVGNHLRDRWHEDLFELVKRLMLGGIFTLGGLAALRFIEYFDVPLLLCALGYTAYAGLRYGGRLLKSLEAASRPFSRFTGEPFAVSALAQRLSDALEFRRSLPLEKRGEVPDRELLDANAYRRLIREGVVSRSELLALGEAVQARLNVSLESPGKISDVMRIEGLDGESAALYRDLALAAAEIAFDSEIK